MIRRDYVMKLLQQLMDALFMLFNKDNLNEEDRKSLLAGFYKDYVGNERDFYCNSSVDEIVEYLDNKYSGETIYRLEMLAEIMYNDSLLCKDVDEENALLRKVLELLLYLDDNSDTYSVVRMGKIDSIREALVS